MYSSKYFKVFYQPVVKRVNPVWQELEDCGFSNYNTPKFINSEVLLVEIKYWSDFYDGDESFVRDLLFRANLCNLKQIDYIELISSNDYEYMKYEFKTYTFTE